MGLIDELGYWDQVNDTVLERGGPDADYLDVADYHRSLADKAEGKRPIIALVQGLGPVTSGASEGESGFGQSTMGADTVSEALSDAIDDPDVSAIVFRVDSPGGSYVASDTIWREVQRAKDLEVPLIISMGNLAASGGYFVAAPAHKIVAQPGTVTGSIGVVAGKMALNDLWQHLSINWDGVQAGANATIWSANKPFSNAEWDRLQDSLDRIYADFTGKVAEGRGLGAAEIVKVAGGRVWSGADALEVGLVDALGGYRTAIDLAKEAAGLEPAGSHHLETLPGTQEPLRIPSGKRLLRRDRQPRHAQPAAQPGPYRPGGSAPGRKA